jgi:hypothetical protein
MGVANLKGAGYPDTNPDGSINTGNASIFTALTHGDLNMSGSSSVNGNAGVGDTGNANLSGSAHINGNLTINNKGKVQHSGSSGVTGTTTKNQTLLDNAWADAISLSNSANGETPTSNYTWTLNGSPKTGMLTGDVNLNNSANITITGGPNQKIVLSLQNFQLDNSSMFTLRGTATTTFIINVAKNFSLDHASQITLVGVPPANVLFNLKGDGKLNAGSQAAGIILAMNGKVTLAGNTGGKMPVSSQVTGRVIAKQVELSDGTSINPITPVTNR